MIKPYKFIKALFYAILLWLIGFIWGTVVFMVPAVKNFPAIPVFSKYPFISFPILLIYILLAMVIARKYLQATTQKASEGLKLGITLVLMNFILDWSVLFHLFKAYDYFNFASVWIAYLILFSVPWFVGKRMQN